MSDTSTFPLPFSGLELPRFLLALDETLADIPGARVTFVELDALLADDPARAVIEITMHRGLIEHLRAEGDPELPDEEEEYWSAEIAVVDDGEQTYLSVNLERNVYVMPAVVAIVESVLQRLGAIGGDDEETDEDEDLDDGEDLDSEDDEDEEFDDEEESDDDDESDGDEEFDDDGESDDGEGEAEDRWNATEAFEQLREFARNTFGEANSDGENAFVFPVTWEEPPVKKHLRVRAFAPTVAMGQGDQASWVSLECEVCPLEKLVPDIAVSLNGEVDFLLSLDGDKYLMSQSFALRSMDGSLFVEMAIALAEQADMVNVAIEQGILQKA